MLLKNKLELKFNNLCMITIVTAIIELSLLLRISSSTYNHLKNSWGKLILLLIDQLILGNRVLV